MRWIVVVLALVGAGWLAFDGAYALISGDSVTPRSGPHAGALGPWSKLFTAIGIDPRCAVVKSLHLIIGIALWEAWRRNKRVEVTIEGPFRVGEETTG